MSISGFGSKPDLFPKKQASVMQNNVRGGGFPWHTDLHLFHCLVSALVEFKVTHEDDRFMILGLLSAMSKLK